MPFSESDAAWNEGEAALQEVAEGDAALATRPARSSLDFGDELSGRVAMVTGGSSGIGRGVVHELARSGADIAFCYLDVGSRSRLKAQEVIRELSAFDVRVLAYPCDVRNSAEVTAFVVRTIDELGGLHILVNNAGVSRDATLWSMTDEEWASVNDTNLTGAFHCIRAASTHFREQEYGKIVNVASVHGIAGGYGIANYAASKAGLIGLTRSAALELGPSNVNVNAVAPGYVRTTTLTQRVSAETLDRAREASALGRLGDPRDVSNVVLFLVSESARHITGAVIPVDGGYLL